jgi:phosphatidylserine/phosphatidylglycerophosphate/cardiolipin synthase-like enzyme
MARRPYVSTYFSPNQGAADQIIGFIDHCTKTIDAAVYSQTHDGIRDALLRAQARGVTIRFLTDALMAKNKWADDEALETSGIAVRRDTQAGAMHNKYVIGDGQAMITGSFNWSKNADRRNAENFVIIRLKYAINAFQGEFDRLWALNED